MKKVAVFGGAFDPPHKGHQEVVEYLLNEVGMDFVEVVPSGLHRHKGLSSTDYLDRFNMAGALFREDPRINISYEDSPVRTSRNKEGAGSSYALMENMKEHWDRIVDRSTSINEYELYLVIGQDNAEIMEDFYRWEDLVKKYKFIVFPRDGYPEEGKWYTKWPHMFVKDFEHIFISSTELRKNLEHPLLPEEVSKYIKLRKLYGLIK